jgi:hypothetical protein
MTSICHFGMKWLCCESNFIPKMEGRMLLDPLLHNCCMMPSILWFPTARLFAFLLPLFMFSQRKLSTYPILIIWSSYDTIRKRKFLYMENQFHHLDVGSHLAPYIMINHVVLGQPNHDHGRQQIASIGWVNSIHISLKHEIVYLSIRLWVCLYRFVY